MPVGGLASTQLWFDRTHQGCPHMTKLHEILAVENGLEQTQRKIVEEARDTFAKKPDHFVASHRALAMFDEKEQGLNAEEHKAMVTTVADKLAYVAGTVTRYLDVVLQKDMANQRGAGDITLDGKVMLANVPVTTLLGLESKLAALREMYLAIPTLAPGREWVPDDQRGRGVYRDLHAELRQKTQKTIRHKVLFEGNKEHPPQIEKWFEDVPVGTITTSTWSGMLTPAEKSDLLERLDKLVRAVKKARMRANTVDVPDGRIGQRIFAYVHDGKVIE